jgi:hypothetical protein
MPEFHAGTGGVRDRRWRDFGAMSIAVRQVRRDSRRA